MVISGNGIKVAVSVIITAGALMVEVSIAVGISSNVPIKSGVAVSETVARLVGEAVGVGEIAKTCVQVEVAVAVGLSVAVLVTVTVGLIVLVAVSVGVIVAVGVSVACCRLIPPRGSILTGSRSTLGANAACATPPVSILAYFVQANTVMKHIIHIAKPMRPVLRKELRARLTGQSIRQLYPPAPHDIIF